MQTQTDTIQNLRVYLYEVAMGMVITFALMLHVFHIDAPKHKLVITNADLHHIFEREREVLHMHPNYGARARYVTITGFNA